MQRSHNKQLFINLVSTAISYAMGLGITFFLTPYVVSHIGIDAYGFLGLANSIIGYTLLVTVALNSMMGRFVSIKYHEGNFEEASRFISSAFWANTFFSLLMVPMLCVFTIYMDIFVDIPQRLDTDVKSLFLLLVLSTFFSLATNAINISTFIRNRLELSNIRGIISNILRAAILVTTFSLFTPHLWYFGFAAIICSVYTTITYWRLYNRLTPELSIRFKFFSISHAIQLIKSGAWNLLSQLSNILNQGLDLLLANVFIGATAMGVLSIVKAIPLIVIGIFGALCGNFAPRYVELYAKGDMVGLRSELLKSIRIMGLFTAIPTAIIYGYSDIFFSVWLPGQDSDLLYMLIIISCIGMNFALPYESLWYIFTLTNTVKRSSINLIEYASATIILVILGLLFTHGNDIAGLFVLCSVRTILGAIRCVTFLPLYGAKVLSFKKSTFYPPLVHNLIVVLIATVASILFKVLFLSKSWSSLITGAAFSTILAVSLSYIFVLTESDKQYIKAKIIHRHAANTSN